MPKKTNVEYLRELISDHVGEKHKDECLEFLEAIENEVDEKKDKITELEEKVSDLEGEESEQAEYANTIETGFPNEPLHWDCNNLSIRSMMEELGSKLETYPAIKIEKILRAI